jgi:adenine-specific DNA methylase
MIKPFIETQFPLARLSLESYKERKANLGQTLTRLGKWWGRKPLILVRASLLGLLMPSSDDPTMDREVFYKILTMDDAGLWKRKSKRLSAKEIGGILPESEIDDYIDSDGAGPRWKRGLATDVKERLEKLAFARLSYEEKLDYCLRPEEIDGPEPEAWNIINKHLGTTAQNLETLFLQLSEKAFGHRARVGDCFCGGGSVPFEAARLGLEAYGSDLNPVAALLTWGAIHLVGGGKEVQEKVHAAQEEAWKKADAQITEWGIEHDGEGNRADAYLYCVEAKCPATGLWVPLAPSWVIGERTNTVAILRRNDTRNGYDIEIIQNASEKQISIARKGTVQGGCLVDPENPSRTFSIASLRGDQRGESYGLRLWENDDIVPRPVDVFQERLYCVRWVTPDGERYYKSVTEEDLRREEKVLALLKERFSEWQEKGFIPSKKIAPGYNTEQPIRERGWTYWHHLFTPRQLLAYGVLKRNIEIDSLRENQITNFIGVGRSADFSARLTKWAPQVGYEITTNVFSNQALNTVYNYATRGFLQIQNSFFIRIPEFALKNNSVIIPLDARDVSAISDLWLTDPPYADAVNYHELADFFLAWYEKQLPKLFPEWYADSRAALAVKGTDEDFKKSMVDIYANLVAHMPDEGLQLVMFTHQDSGVWADLGMILWAAGLRVTAAWTIGTETSSGLKQGNYVQGTVLLVLRKRLSDERAWLDELYPKVDDEVRAQLDLMKDVDDVDSPQFGDTDYQLGAYAAALRVLTSYATIEGMDIRHELFRARKKGEKSEFQKVIDRAVTIATNHRIPRGIEKFTWRNLDTQERLYLSGLEIERHGEVRQGAFMELARGFGVQEYKFLLADTQANQARFRTASEFGRVGLSGDGFASTLLRHLLFAVHETSATEDPAKGLAYLKNERGDYWSRKEDIVALLKFLSSASSFGHLAHWRKDAEAAFLLAGLVLNDYVGSR